MTNKQWSQSWKSSKKAAKQKKFRENAPQHQKKSFVKAKLNDDLRERVGTSTLPVRQGDRCKIMRGDFKRETGEVSTVDYNDYKLKIEGVKREKVDGSDVKVAVDPSNVILTRLELEDERRLRNYELEEEDKEDIMVHREEEEEDSEEETEVSEGEEKDEELEEEVTEDSDEEPKRDMPNYDQLVDDTISNVKEEVKEMSDPDYQKLLQAEKNNKNRKTLVEWLEGR